MLPYIVAGEVLFWVFLLGGLAVRYLLRWRAVSAVLLIGTPVVDGIIIVLTYISLAAGEPSDFSHGLAAFYVGFSLTFGPELIARVDRRFAQRYTDVAEEDLPVVPQYTSAEYVRRCVGAAAVTIAVLGIGIAIAGIAHSFWLIYWIVVAASTPVLWGMFDRLWERYKHKRRSIASS